jgi:hypothetical protein
VRELQITSSDGTAAIGCFKIRFQKLELVTESDVQMSNDPLEVVMTSHSDPSIYPASVVDEGFVKIIDTSKFPSTFGVLLSDYEATSQETISCLVEATRLRHSFELRVDHGHGEHLGVSDGVLRRLCGGLAMSTDQTIALTRSCFPKGLSREDRLTNLLESGPRVDGKFSDEGKTAEEIFH